METCNIEGCIVYYLKNFLTTPHLDSHSGTDPKLEIYQLSKPEIEFCEMEEMYAALHMCTCAEKTTFLDKDD